LYTLSYNKQTEKTLLFTSFLLMSDNRNTDPAPAVNCESRISLNAIRQAIETGNLDFLSENRETIKILYETNHIQHSSCWCGCPQSSSIFTILSSPPSYAWQETNEELEKQQMLYEKSVKFLVENGIIDPNIIVKFTEICTEENRCILAQLLYRYAGWSFQKKMIKYFLEKTSKRVIEEYRDSEFNCTMLQLFLMSNCYDDTTTFNKENGEFGAFVRDYLINECNVDVHNVGCITDHNGKKRFIPTLKNAMDNYSPYLVKLLLSNPSRSDPNFIDETEEYKENMACSMLFHSRYTHKQDFIKEITEILAILIAANLNLNYLTSDNRNITDYCIQNGFSNTSVYQLLMSAGAPAPTGNQYSGTEVSWRKRQETSRYAEPDVYKKHKIVQLLYENRMEKDPVKLEVIYEEFKKLTASDLYLDPKKVGSSASLYNDYISQYGWRGTPIEHHVDFLIGRASD